MSLKVAIPNSDEVEQAVESEGRNGVVGLFTNERLGAISNSHAGEAEHGNVIGAIADGNNLLKRDALAAGDFGEDFGFANSVDDRWNDATGYLAIHNFKIIGVNRVDPETLLPGAGEESEAARQDGRLVTE